MFARFQPSIILIEKCLHGLVSEISDDEVICLDDDDDDNDNRNHNDNNNNGRGNNLQSLANSINPLNQWVTSQPQIIRTNNENNNVRTNIRNPYHYKNKKKLLQFRRYIMTVCII